MYIDADDAKTDVILAGVTAVLGLTATGFLLGSATMLRAGVVGAVVDITLILLLTALVPVLLARHRGDGGSAFGLRAHGQRPDIGRETPVPALALAVPAAIAGVLGLLVAARGTLPAVRLVAPVTAAADPVQLLLGLLQIGALSLGALVLVGFLTMRAADAFPRSPDVPLVTLTRQLTLVLVGVATVGGLLRAIAGASLLQTGAQLLGLVGVLALTDRFLVDARTVGRATVLTPLVVVTAAMVFARGGLFFGDLLGGLTAAALSGGTALAVSAAATTRRGAVLALPLLVAVHWWPTCLTPLAIAPTVC